MFKTSDPHGLKKLWSEPDGEVFMSLYGTGREWSRTLRRRCPHCGDAFYTYQQFGKEQEPNKEDPEPPIVHGIAKGRRATCGAPECSALEYQHQRNRSPALIFRETTQEEAPKKGRFDK